MVENAPRTSKGITLRRHLALTLLCTALLLVACERGDAEARRWSQEGRLGGLQVTERPPLTPPAQAERTLTIVATGDQKGWISTATLDPQARRHTGLAHLAPLLRDLRAHDPELVLLDAGDSLHGAPSAALADKGAPPIVTLLNALAYDAMALGNYDVALGHAALARAEQASRFPWLSANAERPDGGTAYAPYAVLERGSGDRRVRIGVLGLTTPAAALGRAPHELAGLSFSDLERAARRWVPVLRGVERVDVLIGLVHAGLEGDFARDTALRSGLALLAAAGRVAETVPGFDLIIAGDAHELTPRRSADGHTPHGVPVLQPGAYGAALAVATLRLAERQGRWRVAAVERHTVAASAQPDPAALALVAASLARTKERLAEPTTVRFRAVPRKGEFYRCAGALSHAATAVLDETADALSLLPMLWDFEPPIRAEIGRPLTRAHLYRWMRYGERLVRVPLTGRQAELLLEGYVRHERGWRVPPLEVLWPGGLDAVLPDHGSELEILRRAGGGAPLQPHAPAPVWLTAFTWYGGLGLAPQALLAGDAPLQELDLPLREAVFAFLSLADAPLPAPCVRWLHR